MNIKDAQFIISNTSIANCPSDGRLEFAFIGRSNVGKSSLINMLTNRKKLALTSSTPGKTQLINHFLINNEWYVVDLPGYGFAQRRKTDRNDISKIIFSYILHRNELTNLFLLIDCRHAPLPIDLEFIHFLGENGIPFSLVFTKTDKIGKKRLETNIATYKEKLLESWESLPPIFETSSLNRQGRDEILNYIEEINLRKKKSE
jgi:GTP-binding protein